jgi:hypothetical protein
MTTDSKNTNINKKIKIIKVRYTLPQQSELVSVIYVIVEVFHINDANL